MRKTTNNPFKPVWGLFAILLALIAINAVSHFTAGKDKVPWRTDLAAATVESKRESKPVMLYFTASWCEPCQVMKRETWSRDEVVGKLDAYVPVKIDIDQNVTLAERYGIESVPTLLVLDADGNIAKSSIYRLSPDEFINWISSS